MLNIKIMVHVPTSYKTGLFTLRRGSGLGFQKVLLPLHLRIICEVRGNSLNINNINVLENEDNQ